MDRPEAYPTMLRRRINELRGGFRRSHATTRRGGMGWETREQTCPHERGVAAWKAAPRSRLPESSCHDASWWNGMGNPRANMPPRKGRGSLEGCSTVSVTGELMPRRVVVEWDGKPESKHAPTKGAWQPGRLLHGLGYRRAHATTRRGGMGWETREQTCPHERGMAAWKAAPRSRLPESSCHDASWWNGMGNPRANMPPRKGHGSLEGCSTVSVTG